jgi:hypothetical protein
MIKEIVGDVFELALARQGYAVIGTNTTTNRFGQAIMGRGAAAQAKYMFPILPRLFGEFLESITLSGTHSRGKEHKLAIEMPPFQFKIMTNYSTNIYSNTDLRLGIVCFMVKGNWWENASLKIIETQAKAMEFSLRNNNYGNRPIFFTRVGCGNGRLEWHQVEPILVKYFSKHKNVYFVKKED